MALDPKFNAALALHRFGFGPVPGAKAAVNFGSSAMVAP